MKLIIKTLIWRIIATSATFLIAFLLTKKTEVALLIGGVDSVIKTIMYYLYELAWKDK